MYLYPHSRGWEGSCVKHLWVLWWHRFAYLCDSPKALISNHQTCCLQTFEEKPFENSSTPHSAVGCEASCRNLISPKTVRLHLMGAQQQQQQQQEVMGTQSNSTLACASCALCSIKTDSTFVWLYFMKLHFRVMTLMQFVFKIWNDRFDCVRIKNSCWTTEPW